jgi:hypothetical protein
MAYVNKESKELLGFVSQSKLTFNVIIEDNLLKRHSYFAGKWVFSPIHNKGKLPTKLELFTRKGQYPFSPV